MNAPEQAKLNVQYIAKRLNARTTTGGSATTLFLGSRTSSLFRDPFLANVLKAYSTSTVDLSNMKPVERFHACYTTLKTLSDIDKRNVINTVLQAKHVGIADLCIAELMKQELFDFVITTNIGDELELAFLQSGLVAHTHFEVVTLEQDDSLFDKKKGHLFKLIKANGSGYSRTSYRIGEYTIGSNEMDIKHYQNLQDSLKRAKGKNMLIVGFDYEWDKHLMNALLSPKEGDLWYVNEEQTPASSPLSLRLQQSRSQKFEDIIGGYEPFFMNLCWHILGSFPTCYEKTNNIDRILSEVLKIDGTLNDIQDIQYHFQDNMGDLTKTVNKHFEGQETTMKGIKDDIDKLLRRTTPNAPFVSNPPANPSGPILGWQEEDGDSPRKKSEEN